MLRSSRGRRYFRFRSPGASLESTYRLVRTGHTGRGLAGRVTAVNRGRNSAVEAVLNGSAERPACAKAAAAHGLGSKAFGSVVVNFNVVEAPPAVVRRVV